jgi:hypothetical protein
MADPATPGAGSKRQAQAQAQARAMLEGIMEGAEAIERGGSSTAKSNSYALLLGYVMKARSSFFQNERKCTVLAEEDFAALVEQERVAAARERSLLSSRGGSSPRLQAQQQPSSGVAAAAAARGLDRFIALTEFVSLQEQLERDRLEADQVQKKVQQRSARRIQAVWRVYQQRRAAAQQHFIVQAAALTIQRIFRGFAVRKKIMGSIRLKGLSKKYSLVKIRTWYKHLRVWVAIAKSCARMRAQDRLAMKTQALYLLSQRRQFEALELHAVHKSLVATQLAQWRAAVVIQKYVRRYLAIDERYRRLAAVVRIQALVRGYRARLTVRSRREILRHHEERRRKVQWALTASQRLTFFRLEEEMVLRHVLLAKEMRQADQELTDEHARLNRHYARWSDAVREYVLAQPLVHPWVPQLDKVTGSTYYLNTASGETSTAHPNAIYVELSLMKGGKNATQAFVDQTGPLRQYITDLEEAHEANRRWYEAKIKGHRSASLIEHTGSWGRVDFFPAGPTILPPETNLDLQVLPTADDIEDEFMQMYGTSSTGGMSPMTFANAVAAAAGLGSNSLGAPASPMRALSGSISGASGASSASAAGGGGGAGAGGGGPGGGGGGGMSHLTVRAEGSSSKLLRNRSAGLLSAIIRGGDRDGVTPDRPKMKPREAEVVEAHVRAAENQLSLSVGQIVIVTDYSEGKAWWQGQLYGKKGIFPRRNVALFDE